MAQSLVAQAPVVICKLCWECERSVVRFHRSTVCEWLAHRAGFKWVVT